MHYLEQELRERLQPDASFLDFLEMSALDGLWFWDLEDPEHEWMSPGFWKVFGIDPDDRKHLASEWQEMIHPEDLEMARGNLERHLADPDHRYDQVVRYRHQLGHWIWVRCRGIALRDDDGRPIRMFGAHTDVTELMNARIQLEIQVQRLEAIEMRIELETRRRQALEDELARVRVEQQVNSEAQGGGPPATPRDDASDPDDARA